MGEYTRNKSLRRAVKENRACFGTVDSWLLYELTGKKVHATDYSEASATLMFDPFTQDWGWALLRYVGAPRLVMPKVQGSCSIFGHTDEGVVGAKIPIACLVSGVCLSWKNSVCSNAVHPLSK
jgi:glycerol kinase